VYQLKENIMAQREEKTNNLTYLVVKHHSLCEESKTPKENFVEVEVRNPKTNETVKKYIDKWGAVTGYITKIEHYDTGDKYDTRFQGFKLFLDDEVVVDLPHKTASYDSFCKLAENIDFNKEVTISAYHNRAKDRTGFSVKQDGKNVDWKYTQEHMFDCPPWEKDEEGEWDSRKQRAFLKSKIIDVVIPKVEEAAKSRAPKASAATASTGNFGTSDSTSSKVAPDADDLDDIPF
jgi:hypothetical protein